MVATGQLPLVVVCASTIDDDADRDELAGDVAFADELLAVVVRSATVDDGLAVRGASRQASTPPSDSIEATLTTVAQRRARAAFGRRRDGGVGEGRACMRVNVRSSGERASRSR
jgi:hypothetical protein